MLQGFCEDVKLLGDAVFIPLGKKVSDTLSWLADQGLLDGQRILHGIPHPSGANAERIAYMLERKSREACSSKCDPVKLDRSRLALQQKILTLMSLK